MSTKHWLLHSKENSETPIGILQVDINHPLFKVDWTVSPYKGGRFTFNLEPITEAEYGTYSAFDMFPTVPVTYYKYTDHWWNGPVTNLDFFLTFLYMISSGILLISSSNMILIPIGILAIINTFRIYFFKRYAKRRQRHASDLSILKFGVAHFITI